MSWFDRIWLVFMGLVMLFLLWVIGLGIYWFA